MIEVNLYKKYPKNRMSSKSKKPLKQLNSVMMQSLPELLPLILDKKKHLD